MIQEDFITLTLEKQKNIALIAHDNEKHSLIEWCKEHKDILSLMRNRHHSAHDHGPDGPVGEGLQQRSFRR